ncbi:MAG TPA: N-(5'-phosphoribosyl)anthranilate isomerase [Planctomycetaceae bacterium]|nr:N-(5'-phosphoribosyl)anthranilate isomerase [Planctomycetaceae bacterium]
MSNRIPRIKVCGVTVQEDLDVLAEFEVDSVGLNFVPISKRKVAPDQAGILAKRAHELGLSVVGVFMNQSPSDVARVLAHVSCDFVQLHGDERPEDFVDCKAPIIKAISWSGRSEETDLASSWANASNLRAFLLDAYAPAEGGGTGRQARWDLLVPRPKVFGTTPVILAGGITSENVAQAVSMVRPDGVDTASGVESAPGRKARSLVQAFAAAARKGWEGQ